MNVNWSKVKNAIIIVLIIVCVALIMSTTCTARKNKILENNIESLNDTVEEMKLKNGELAFAKQSLILEKKELEEYLGISKKEYKELEKRLNSSLAYISKLEGIINIDSLRMEDSVSVSNDTAFIHFGYNDNWLSLRGTTRYYNDFACTNLYDIRISLPIKVGFSDEYRAIVTTQCPYIKFTNIESAVINGGVASQKPKRWGFGPTITAGFGWGWGTDFSGNNIGGKGGLIAGFMVGFSLHYDIFQW